MIARNSSPAARLARDPAAPGRECRLTVAGMTLVMDPRGALYWPDEGVLAVADLHLEKGSSFAARGMLVPPYDTAATLARLGAVIGRYAPRRVIALGDSFHDGEGPARIAASDRTSLAALQRGRDWLWIAGNHDPDPIRDLGGRSTDHVAIGTLTFRHEPTQGAADGEIAGHLHPVARLAVRGRGVSRPCFASDGRRLVMPAFGAYAGGLNIRDRAFADLFVLRNVTAHLLGDGRVYAIGASRCLAG